MSSVASVDGTCAHLPVTPGRASWALRPSKWSGGFLVVNFAPVPEGEIVCFAPPGTSLWDERGLGTAFWRRGVWRSESEFVGQRCPHSVEVLSVAETLGEIPGDFAAWARGQSASHVEMLRAFAHRRPDRPELRTSASQLREELEDVEPGAMERCLLELGTPTLHADLLERRELEREPRIVAPTSITWLILRRLPMQVALFASLYGLYRVARPGGPGLEPQRVLGLLSPSVLFDDLLWVYGNVHVPLFFAFVGWVLLKRHTAFDFIRNSFVATAAAAIGPYLFISSNTYETHPSQSVPASAVPTMPALHLSLGIAVGLWGFFLCRSFAPRLLWLTYPFLTLAVVIASEPADLLATIAWALAAVVLGLLAATAAGHWRASWRNPHLPSLKLPRLPGIPNY